MPWTDVTAPALTLPSGIRRALIAEARAGLPSEVCGILLGTASGDEVVTSHVPMTNRSADPSRAYAIATTDLEPFLRTDEVIGVYHSHPDGPARFSAVDARTEWRGWWYVIIGTARPGDPSSNDELVLTAWRDGRPGEIRP